MVQALAQLVQRPFYGARHPNVAQQPTLVHSAPLAARDCTVQVAVRWTTLLSQCEVVVTLAHKGLVHCKRILPLLTAVAATVCLLLLLAAAPVRRGWQWLCQTTSQRPQRHPHQQATIHLQALLTRPQTLLLLPLPHLHHRPWLARRRRLLPHPPPLPLPLLPQSQALHVSRCSFLTFPSG